MSRVIRILPVMIIVVPMFGGSPRLLAQKNEPDPALRTYLSANGLLNRGLHELAAAEYRAFLRENEDHEKAPVARYGLGVCLFRLKQYEEAVKELSPLARKDDFEFSAEAGTISGQCYLALKQANEAVEAFQRVVTAHEDHALADDAAAGLIESLYLIGRHAEAAARSEAFVARWSESALRERVLFFQGAAYMAVKRYADAAGEFAALQEDFGRGELAAQASLLQAQCLQQNESGDEAVRQYRRVIKEGDERFLPDALYGLATILYRKGEFAEAGEWLDQLLERFPTHSLAPMARFYRGRILFEAEQYDDAAKMFDATAGDDTSLAGAQAYWTAKCDLRRGRAAEAAERLSDAVKRYPDHDLAADMMYDRAVALLKAEQAEEAVAAMTAFRSRFPDHPLSAEALQLLAVTEHQRAQYEASDRFARAYVEAYPSAVHAATMRFLIGENAFLAGRLDDAVVAYEAFLAEYPEHGQRDKATFRLGMACFRLERFDEAEAHLTAVAGLARREPLFRPALLALGEIQFREEAWQEAEEQFEAYLAGGPDQAAADDALLKLGLAQQRQDRHEAALATHDRLLEQFESSPHRLQAMFERGQALVSLGRAEEAAKAFEAVVAEGSDTLFAAHALNHLGALAMRRGDHETAAKYFERVTDSTESDGLSADALFRQGQSLMAARRFAEAEKSFAEFGNRFASHMLADDAGAQRAIALSRQDKHEEAVRAIEAVEERHGSRLEPSLRASLTYELAWCLRALGRTDEAAKAYRSLVDAEAAGPYRAHAVLELAGLEMQVNRYDEAATLLTQLVQSAGDGDAALTADLREQTMYRLGVCAFERKQMRDSAELFEQFVEQFPKSSLMASALFYAGEAQFTLGRFEAAAAHLTRVTEAFEKDAMYEPALLRLGEALAQLQHWARSERVFAEYLSRFPESSQWFQAQFGLGWARENQKRHDEAIAAYRSVIERHQGPTAARAQFQIGECLFAQEKFEDAVRELLKVDILYAYPEWSAAALYEAGRAFEKLNKTAEARTQFKEVAERHQDSHWARLASQRLNELSSAALPGR